MLRLWFSYKCEVTNYVNFISHLASTMEPNKTYMSLKSIHVKLLPVVIMITLMLMVTMTEMARTEDLEKKVNRNFNMVDFDLLM